MPSPLPGPARFTFDLDLGDPSSRASAQSHGQNPAQPPAGMPEELVARLVADARAEGFAEGRKAGEREAASMAAQTLASAAAALATRTADMAKALDAGNKAHLREAVDLAATVGRKLAGHLLARYPMAEIEALIAECLASLESVPHLVIRCHPEIADAVRETATGRMAVSGFSGRLVVMGDPEQRLGDGRLEWVDGGLVRDISAISGEIDTRISAYLAARGVGRNEDNGA